MIETLCAIKREASLAGFAHIYPTELYPYPDEPIRAELAASLARDTVRVFLDPEERGYALVEGDRLHQLFVRPAAWGTGAAASLLAQAVDAGARSLWVMEQNARARRFYEKHGWRPSLGYTYDVRARSSTQQRLACGTRQARPGSSPAPRRMPRTSARLMPHTTSGHCCATPSNGQLRRCVVPSASTTGS